MPAAGAGARSCRPATACAIVSTVDEPGDIDVEQLLTRIREDIGRRRSAADGPDQLGSAWSLDPNQVAADFVKLRSVVEPQTVPLSSHRRLLGPFIVAVKTLVRKLLTPSLEAQATFNATSIGLMAQIKGAVEALDRRQAAAERDARERAYAVSRLANEVAILKRAESRVQEVLAAQSEQIQALAAQLHQRVTLELEAQSRALQSTRESNVAAGHRLSTAERKLRRILHALHADAPGNGQPVTKPEDAGRALSELEPEFDYAGFEERFRGHEEDIKARQRLYLPYFEGRAPVLDIGCGRGEFLELLRERHIDGRGVDADLDMVLLGRDKGLDVVMQDGLTCLAALPDDSLGGVFGGQLVEHLPSRQIIELVKLCHRKLAPGGVLILETPNPQCLMVFADSFYRDLTHLQPIHPDTMQFLLEATGFRDVEVKFSGPVDPAMRLPSLRGAEAELEGFNRGIERLNALLFGFQDYAVIGRKG